MFKLATIAALLFMAGPSTAQTIDPRLVEQAPPEYWRAPDAPALVIYGNPREVDAACRAGANVPADRFILACTYPEARGQIMPNPCLFPDEFYARLQCHENAHLPRRDGTAWVHPPVR